MGRNAAGAAREPPRLREGDRARHGEVRGGNDPAAAELDRLPAAAGADRVLAGPPVPPARPGGVHARRGGRPAAPDAAASGGQSEPPPPPPSNPPRRALLLH